MPTPPENQTQPIVSNNEQTLHVVNYLTTVDNQILLVPFYYYQWFSWSFYARFWKIRFYKIFS